MFDWVLLVYGIIFGTIALYLFTLWRRVQNTDRELKERKM